MVVVAGFREVLIKFIFFKNFLNDMRKTLNFFEDSGVAK